MSASAPPRGAFSNQPLQKRGFLRDGANSPVNLRIRPPMPANGTKQILQRGLAGTLRKTLRMRRTGFSPSARSLRQNSALSSLSFAKVFSLARRLHPCKQRAKRNGGYCRGQQHQCRLVGSERPGAVDVLYASIRVHDAAFNAAHATSQDSYSAAECALG